VKTERALPERAGKIIPPGLVPVLLAITLMGCGDREDGEPERDAVTPEEPGMMVPAEPLEPAVSPEPGDALPDFTLPFPDPPPIAGELVLVDGELAFQRCGDPGPLTVMDGTGSEATSIVEELGYGSGRVLATVILQEDLLTEVRYATPEGPGCRDMLPEAALWAAGNEPFWSLRIEGEGARWITPEEMEGVVYDAVWWSQPAEGIWNVQGERADTDPEAAPDAPAPGEAGFAMVLEAERCIDTMSGARFPFAVRVEREGRSYRGCAVEGRLFLGETP